MTHPSLILGILTLAAMIVWIWIINKNKNGQNGH
jgi:hypothetical protein